MSQAGFEGETLLVGVPPGFKAPEGLTVRMIPAPPLSSPQQRRAIGLVAGRAELLASVSEDYQVDRQWIEAALRVSADVTCGPVVVADAAGYWERAAWMWEYAHLADAEQSGPIRGAEKEWIPAGNVVYRRAALPPEAFAAANSEMEAHRNLSAAGLTFARDPRLRARYQPPSPARFLADRRRWSRLGALDRPSVMRALALPPVLLLRQARHWLGRRGWRLRFLLALPTFVVFALAQSLGELEAIFSPGGGAVEVRH